MPVAPARAADAPSEYACHTPLLYELVSLPVGDRRRAQVREQLILAFLPVADHLASRHANPRLGVTREELVQIGTVALINAIDRWDPALAHGEFLGYLVPCVRGEMLRWFRDRTWAVRVPRRLKEVAGAVGRIVEPLSQELGRAPRPSELASRLGITVEEVVEALEAQAERTARSFDAVDPDTGFAFVDRLGTADANLDKVEYRHVLRPLLDALPERERTIIRLRFFGEMTQSQIAQRIGVSQMHVSRLLSLTLRRLRVELTADDPAGSPMPAYDGRKGGVDGRGGAQVVVGGGAPGAAVPVAAGR